MHFTAASYDTAGLSAALDTNAAANMWAHTRNDTGVQEYVLTPLDGSGLSVLTSTGLPAKWKGTQALADTVPQAAPIIKLTTAKRGRRFRGRIYLPFPQETALNSSLLDQTIRTAMQTAWNTWRTAMSSAGFPLVVASYANANKENVTATFVEQLLATQRRRQPR